MRKWLVISAAVGLVLIIAAALLASLHRDDASTSSDAPDTAQSPGWLAGLRSASLAGAKPPERPDLARAPTAHDDASLPGGEVEGWVLDSDTHEPIAQVQLAFMALGGVHLVTTRADGEFSFRPPTPGEYALEAMAKDGYRPLVALGWDDTVKFDLFKGRSVRGVRLALSPWHDCPGVALFADGGAAVGAHVAVRVVAREKSPLVVSAPTAVSGDGGKFHIGCLDRTSYEGTLDGFPPAYGYLGRQERSLELVFGEESPGRWDGGTLAISGTVVDSVGRPVAGADVSAMVGESRGGIFTERGVSVAEAGPSGEFALDSLRVGTYTVRAWLGTSGLSVDAKEVSAGTTGVELRLPAEGDVEVHVATADGTPVTEFSWSTRPAAMGAAFIGGMMRPVVSPRGVDRREHVVAGEQRVSVEAPGYVHEEPTHVSVVAGQTAIAHVVLEAGGRLHVRVRDAATHAPIPTALAGAASRNSWSMSTGLAGERIFRANAQGELVIEGVDPYRDLHVEAPSYRSYDLSQTKLEDESVLVELLPATGDAGTDPVYGGVGIGWGKGSEVASVTPGGPAQRAGVVPGDVFWKVNDQEMPAAVANPMIRGPVGTPVRLAFHRADGGVLDETMIRETIDPNALRSP